jgi:membrane protease YdiL (CAAX protease family)
VRLGWLTFLSTFDLVPAYWSSLKPSSAGSAVEASRLIVVGALAPCVEELLFRGLIFRRCLRRHGALSAALWSSLLFGICHFDAVGAGLFGLVLAGLYIQSKSLWVAVAAHGFANLVVARGPYVKELLNAHGALAWAIAAVQLGCLPWLAWFLHRSLRSLRS